MKTLVWALPILCALVALSGCGNGTAATPVSTGEKSAAPAEPADTKAKPAGHESAGHTHVAPHGGLVNSIGNYHVELVYNSAASKLMLYVLGEDGTTSSPIDATAISGQFKIEGGADFTPVTLNPSPLEKETAGTASKFEAIVPVLDGGKTYEVFIRPSIDGKSYRTAFQLTPGKGAVISKSYACPMFKEHPKLYSAPGKCPLCQMVLVETKDGKVEHSDHSPKHGGTFFMASDNWHHLEGVLVSATEFRVYLYDNFTKPMSAQDYNGTGEVIRQDSKGDDLGTAFKLKLVPSADRSYLVTTIPADYVAPLAFTTRIALQKGEKPSLFNFTFDKPSFK